MNSFLQIFMLVNVFVIGAVLAIAVQHAYAHFRPHSEQKPHVPAAQPVRLSPDVKERLLENAKEHFQTILNRSADELDSSLKTTVAQLNVKLEKMAVDIVNDEMRRYRMDLDQLRKQTEANISGAQTEISQHQADLKEKIDQKRTELEAKLEEEMVTEKQALMTEMDAKLADSMASFLVETLGHNVDLGSQNAYLIGMLEEHKAELIKGVADES